MTTPSKSSKTKKIQDEGQSNSSKMTTPSKSSNHTFKVKNKFKDDRTFKEFEEESEFNDSHVFEEFGDKNEFKANHAFEEFEEDNKFKRRLHFREGAFTADKLTKYTLTAWKPQKLTERGHIEKNYSK